MSINKEIKSKQEESVWVIRHKETKELLKVPSGKTSWRKPAHAKNAWSTFGEWGGDDIIKKCCDNVCVTPVKNESRYTESGYRLKFPKFDEQDTWELYNAGKDYGNTAVELLTKCLGRLTDSKLEQEIMEFLGKEDNQ